ncbi:APC family permease [Gordonia otitidis]|uniref:APC family permease n=1 Tax=Gordonia otitidis TaxID=249058 RepID=UPI001D15676F|nr:APC family permease [Gordonia otitidis]UEA58762.1 APC family permease [Gordonia otitidis]
MASTETAETRRRTAQFSGSRPWQDQHVDSDRHPRGRDKRELTATTGLAALSLDAMASVAYGPEAIVVVLAAAGGHALGLTLPVSAAIVALLAVLVLSYRQLIAAFPNGGGAYAVARTYLGRRTSLVAAASLVIDYVLNVAVSVTAGTAALTSAFPAAGSYSVGIALGILAMITLVNLRGVVSSAKTFIIPTGVFVASILSVIVVGLLRGGHTAPQPAPEIVGSVGILLLLKAFANGCAALTGVEAIANATPQFRENRIRRAQRAEVALGGLLGVMMLGIAALVERLHIHPQPGVTVLSQLTESVFGRGALYYVVQIATIVLLGLAANTSFGGLPQLMKVVAADDHFPHRLTRRTRTGVYREGVLILAGTAAVLIIASGGDVNALVPLFAICVFIGFTLAQIGLVRHWSTVRSSKWRLRAALNGFGALFSGLAAAVLIVMKADEGSLCVIVVLGVLVIAMEWLARHYRRARDSDVRAAADTSLPTARPRHSFAGQGVAVVPVASALCCATNDALRAARAFGREVRAVHVAVDEDPAVPMTGSWSSVHDAPQFVSEWRRFHPVDHLTELRAADEDAIVEVLVQHVSCLATTDDVLVVIPDTGSSTRSRLLSSGRADDLERALLGEPGVLVARSTSTSPNPGHRSRRDRAGSPSSP